MIQRRRVDVARAGIAALDIAVGDTDRAAAAADTATAVVELSRREVLDALE